MAFPFHEVEGAFPPPYSSPGYSFNSRHTFPGFVDRFVDLESTFADIRKMSQPSLFLLLPPPRFFFCWRLLGLIPGGTPFSQLNKGVRDAMSATTKRDVKHQVFCKNMQRATGTNKVQTRGKECRVSRRHKEEGSGEIQRKAPMPEWEDATKGRELW